MIRIEVKIEIVLFESNLNRPLIISKTSFQKIINVLKAVASEEQP